MKNQADRINRGVPKCSLVAMGRKTAWRKTLIDMASRDFDETM